MAALSFAEKNRLLVKHKNTEYFYKDLELFRKLYPGHKLNNDLANVTSFSKVRLSEQMLLLLLDKASIDEIQENRGIIPPKERSYEEKIAIVLSKYGNDYIVKSTDDLKDIAIILGHPEPESLGSYASLVGKPISELLFDSVEDSDEDLDNIINDGLNLVENDTQDNSSKQAVDSETILDENNLPNKDDEASESTQEKPSTETEAVDHSYIGDKKSSEEQVYSETIQTEQKSPDKKKEAKAKSSPK